MSKKILLIAGAAVAALLLLRRPAPASAQQQAINKGQGNYWTPTTVAQLFNAAVILTNRPGAQPVVREQSIVGFDWQPWGPKTDRALADYQAANPAPGTFTLGAGVNALLDGWTGPKYSFVKEPAAGSAQADANLGGGVYDIGTDWINNPLNEWGNA